MRRLGVFVVVIGVLLSACSSNRATPTGDPRQATSTTSGSFVDIGSGILVSDAALAPHLRGSVDTAASPPAVGFGPWGVIYRVDATSQPDTPVTIRIPAPGPLPDETAVILLAADSPTGPWEPLETGQQLADGTIEATTSHFSWFTAILAPFVDIVNEARRIFDDATAGFVAEAEQPLCEGEAEARQVVEITSTSSDAVKWCLGVENGTIILRVTNNRRYALQASHAGMSVIDAGVDPTSIAQLSTYVDPALALLSVRRPATLSVDATTASMNVEFNGLADSLYQLQVGIETALSLLSKFGVSGDRYEAVATLLQGAKCAETLNDPTGGNIIGNCFDAKSILTAFGPKAVFVAALMTVAPLIEFFHSRFNAIGDVISGRDRYTISVTPVAHPETQQPTPVSGVLAEGSTGDEVRRLQQELVDRGYQVDVDGVFGPGTTSAVRQAQEALLLGADGLVGPRTKSMLGLGTANEAGPGVTADQLVESIIVYLGGGAPSVPADVVTALSSYRDFRLENVTWSSGEPTAGVSGRVLYPFAYAGDGGVYIYGEICIRPPSGTTPALFCGVWDISGH